MGLVLSLTFTPFLTFFYQGAALQFTELKIMPQIMALYDKNGWEMGLFYLENGHAEIRGMMDLKEEFDV